MLPRVATIHRIEILGAHLLALFVDLVKALVWPLLWFFVILMFRREIRLLLLEVPTMVRRVRSAHGFGVEVKLDKIGEELSDAELRTSTNLSFPIPKAPQKTDGSDADANS